MSFETDLKRLSPGELATKVRDDLIPLNNRFAYFFAALPPSEEDVQEYLREPIAAMPPSLMESLPPISVLMVPYLERVNRKLEGRVKVEDFVCFDKPADRDRIWASKTAVNSGVALVFALKDQDVADYHHSFYRFVADVAIDVSSETARDEYAAVLIEELNGGVHGEVDEESWRLKQELAVRQRRVQRKTKGFAAYARQSLLDTLTLYLHGICCDIDVETGPRQVAGRHLRRRLELLQSIYPSPDGFCVFPEDLNHKDEGKNA